MEPDEAPTLADLRATMASPHADEWLTPQEAADAVGRSPRTLAKWRQRGEGPAFFRYGRSGVRYLVSAVEAWRAGLA